MHWILDDQQHLRDMFAKGQLLDQQHREKR